MSKSNKSSSKPPEPPKPQNEYFYDDGFLRSSRVMDKGKGGYVTNSYSTAAEKAISDQGTQYIADLLPRAQQAFNMSPEQIGEYREAYAAPQRRALDDSYNKALGQARGLASASGVRNSVGFNDYLANQIEKNRAQGMADIEGNAKLMEYEIPRMALAPFMDAFNLYSGAQGNQNQQQMNAIQPAFQGSQAANNFALSNYNNQLAYHQMQNQNNGGGSFFSRLLFGGF